MQVTLPAADVICIYGLPDHELYLDLKAWLDEKEERFVVVLEDDERALFAHNQGHERIRLCNVENEESLKRVAWELVFLQFDYAKTAGNSSKNLKNMESIFSKMAYLQQGIHLVASDFQNRGIDLLHNLLENSALLGFAKPGKELFGAFAGIPAIICGAGASLEKEIETLKNLQGHALIFSGGTALSSLGKFGITPHFGGVIDPHPPSSRYFEYQSFDYPVFFQSRAHPQLLKKMKGPLLWIQGSQNDIVDEEPFDGGWNVSTFLAAIAFHLGCNPIILAGVDLAQRGEKAYAGDFERPEGGDLIWVKEDLFTRRDFLFAADWLSHFAKGHPQVEWINCSDGLEIAGFEKRSLKELKLEAQTDFIHEAIENLRPGISSNLQIEKSLSRVSLLCSDMLELLERLFPGSPEKNGEYALLEIEIERESAYTKFLKPVWDVWKHVFARQIPKDIPAEYGIGLNQWLFIKGICDDARRH